MADPDHTPDLDAFDRTTVRLYRAGLVISAVGLTAAAAANAVEGSLGAPLVATAAGVSLAVGNLHLYDKRIRWLIVMSTQLGMVGLLAGPWISGAASHWIATAGLGFVFVSLSGLALKEQFCFRVPFLRAVPVVLAASLVPVLAEWPLPSAVLLGVAAGLQWLLALAKLRMPLHFDIGDKSRYQT